MGQGVTGVLVRPAKDADFPALARLDLTYPTDRLLTLEREGEAPEWTWRLRWRNGAPGSTAVYADYGVERLRRAMERTDLFLVVEIDGRPSGLLMIVVPAWTYAAEITDLAVDRRRRRRGAGRALVQAAAAWGRERGYRALWVEPRADNAEAIEFYLTLGFRLSGFNDRMYSNLDDEPGRTTLYMYLELA